MFEVIIVDNHDFMRKEMYIVQKDVDGRVVKIAKPIELVFEDRKEGVEVKPTLIIDTWNNDGILDAFNRAFGKSENNPDELKATQAHLKDMKTIAFKKLNIETSHDQ